MPYPQSNIPRQVEAAFVPPPGLPHTPPAWDPYPRYVDADELNEALYYRAPLIVLLPGQAVPPGTPSNTIVLRRSA